MYLQYIYIDYHRYTICNLSLFKYISSCALQIEQFIVFLHVSRVYTFSRCMWKTWVPWDPIFTRAPWFDEGNSSACKSREPMSSSWTKLRSLYINLFSWMLTCNDSCHVESRSNFILVDSPTGRGSPALTCSGASIWRRCSGKALASFTLGRRGPRRGLAMLGWTQSESDVKSLWSYVIPNPIGLPVQHRDFAFLRKHDAINQFPTIPAIALTSCSLVMPCSLCKSKIGVARLLGHQQRIIPSFCSRYSVIFTISEAAT